MSKTINIISVDVLDEDIAQKNIWPMCLPTSRVVQDGEDIRDVLKPVKSDWGHTCYLTHDLEILASTDPVIAQLAVEAIQANHYLGEIDDVPAHRATPRNMQSIRAAEMMYASGDNTPMPKRGRQGKTKKETVA